MSWNPDNLPHTTREVAEAKLAKGQVNPPNGYCRRCWMRDRAVTLSTVGMSRCDRHAAEIREEEAQAAARREARAASRLAAAP